jgi:hypothetical protein
VGKLAEKIKCCGAAKGQIETFSKNTVRFWSFCSVLWGLSGQKLQERLVGDVKFRVSSAVIRLIGKMKQRK